MPKENTHLFIADKVFRYIKDKEIRAIISKNMEEYLLGAFFPDMFMYSFKHHHIAKRLHGGDGEKTNELIFLMLDHLKEKPNERDLASLFGYITHCAADIIFHPMVIFLSGDYYSSEPHSQRRARYNHHRIETFIDIRLKHKLYVDGLTSTRSIKGLVLPSMLAEMFDTDEKKMKRTVRICLWRQLASNRLYRSSLAYLLVKSLVWIGFLNMLGERGVFYHDVKDQQILPDKIKYKNPVTGKESTDTIESLMNDSIKLSLKMIIAAKKYYNNSISKEKCEKTITGASLETGLVGAGVKEMIYFS